MVAAPASMNEPLGSGSRFLSTGVTRSRSRSRGVLLIGLDVSARLPPTAGGGKACPAALGVKPEPCARTTWLLMMSTGMSRIDVSSFRRHLGQRIEMSNSFSPSTMVDWGWAAMALVTTLLTSAVVTPHFWHFERIDAELQVRRAADVEDAHVGDALDVLQDVLGLGRPAAPAGRCPGRRS